MQSHIAAMHPRDAIYQYINSVTCGLSKDLFSVSHFTDPNEFLEIFHFYVNKFEYEKGILRHTKHLENLDEKFLKVVKVHLSQSDFTKFEYEKGILRHTKHLENLDEKFLKIVKVHVSQSDFTNYLQHQTVTSPENKTTREPDEKLLKIVKVHVCQSDFTNYLQHQTVTSPENKTTREPSPELECEPYASECCRSKEQSPAMQITGKNKKRVANKENVKLSKSRNIKEIRHKPVRQRNKKRILLNRQPSAFQKENVIKPPLNAATSRAEYYHYVTDYISEKYLNKDEIQLLDKVVDQEMKEIKTKKRTLRSLSFYDSLAERD